MKNRVLISMFFLALLVDLLATAFNQEYIRYLSKPLLTILLAVYFFSSTAYVSPVYRLLMLSALFFSLLGDVFLMFEPRGQQFFMLGLGSFLLAHLSYIGFFLKIRYTNYPLPLCKWPFIFLTEAIVLAFIFFILPYLGNMTLPVIIYAITISMTTLTAMHAFRLQEQPAGWLCLTGAILFIISDGLIAIQHFYTPIPAGNVLVMLTYGLAQLGLVTGGSRFLQTRKAYEWR